MAYSNVTPPTLPSYDSVANPYYLIQFEYALGAENWETVRFWYGAAPLTWNGSAVTNAVAFSMFTYGIGSPEWTAWGVMAEAGEMALTPGPTTADTYMRLYTNHDILDGTGAVWLAKGTVTPTEEDKEAEIQIRIKSQLAGIIAAWCATVRQFPKPTAEPVAFLYNGVRLPDIYKVYTPEMKEQLPHAYILEFFGRDMLILSPVPMIVESNGGLTVPESAGTVTLYTYWRGSSAVIEAGWAGPEYRDQYYGYIDMVEPSWANTDVYKEDGTLYLAASKPVPVYE